MRADAGVTQGQVPVPGQQQGIGQRMFGLAPAGQEAHASLAEFGQELGGGGGQHRLQPGQVVGAQAAEALAGIHQLQVPGIQGAGRRSALEQGIALLQGPGVPPPGRKEARFHVEQGPVQEAPPVFGAPGDQFVAAGFKADHGQLGAQLRQARRRRPVQPGFPLAAGMAQAGPAGTALAVLPLRINRKRRLAAAHQAVAHAPPEGPAVAQQVDGLDQAGLAGAVAAGHQVQAGNGFEADFGQAAQVLDVQPGQAHGGQGPRTAAPQAGGGRKRHRPAEAGR